MAITINVNLDEILQALKDDLDFTGNADKYIKVNATADGFEFAAVSGGGTWGSITGTLSDQTDLQSALDLKANLSGAAFTGDVSVTTSGSGDTLQLTNSGSGTTLNIDNSGSGDFLTIDSTKLVIDNGGDVSIGTATASARFHVLTGSTSQIGAIIQAAAGQTANLLEIRNSSGTTISGVDAIGVFYSTGLSANLFNTAFGPVSLRAVTSGINNCAFGNSALSKVTTGSQNSAFGKDSLKNITTSSGNSAFGREAMVTLSSGSSNSAFGEYALANASTSSENSAIGHFALIGITTGGGNSAIGKDAGRYISAGTNNQTSTNSVYLGAFTRSSANGNTNEIVIGYNAIGSGSNTVTLGHTSITDTYLRGTVRTPAATATRAGLRILSGTDPSSPVAGDIWFDGTNLKFYDGTTTHNIV